jgi:hypothetical protein
METPPFRLARSPGVSIADSRDPLRIRSADACCQPAQPALRLLRRRVRLAELDSHLHCSVIGTCLSTNELRKLVPKFAEIDRQRASDLEIHHTAVELAIADGPGSKALHKALDERYAGAIRRSASCTCCRISWARRIAQTSGGSSRLKRRTRR